MKKRERMLLWLCIATLFLAANVYLASIVLGRIKTAKKDVTNLENEVARFETNLLGRSQAEERMAYLDEHLPALEGAGKTQGQMLEEIQNQIRDRKFESDRQTLVEPRSSDHYEEVAVAVRLSGDAMEVMRWLVTLQQPNQFYIIKELELELDKRSEKKEPQARCNLTLARWFKPVAS